MAEEQPGAHPHAALSIEGQQDISHPRATGRGLSAVTLHARRGSFVVLIGPSGCGKSALLRLVAGLEEPDEGSVRVRNKTPRAFRARGELSIAFQDPALLPGPLAPSCLRGGVCAAFAFRALALSLALPLSSRWPAPVALVHARFLLDTLDTFYKFFRPAQDLILIRL